MASRPSHSPSSTEHAPESSSRLGRLWSRIASTAASTKQAVQSVFEPKPKPRQRYRPLPAAEVLEVRRYLSADVPVADVHIVDNGEAEYVEVGSWQTSSLQGLDGSDSRYAGVEGGSATWSFAVGEGEATVEAHVPTHENSATSALYTIVNNGVEIGSVTLDQRSGGWLQLGAYNVQAGSLQITGGAPGQTFRADAVRVTVEGAEQTSTEPETGPVVIYDTDFSQALDPTGWVVDDDHASDTQVVVDNGQLTLANRGAVITNEELIATPATPVTITTTWTPVSDEASNTHALTIQLRTNGNMNDATQDRLYLVAYTNLNVFFAKKDGSTHTKIAEDKSKVLQIGHTYDVTVVDSGTSIRAVIADSSGQELINLSANVGQDEASSGGHIIVESRDNGVSRLDDLKIETIGTLKPDAVDAVMAEESTPTIGPMTVIEDDFSGDLSQWIVDDTKDTDTRVYVDNGQLVAENAGAIIAPDTVRGTAEAPVTISGTWTPVSDAASNTHAMEIYLRSDGQVVGNEAQDGIQLVAYTNHGAGILQIQNGQGQWLALDQSGVLQLGQTYHFTITDDGTNVTASISDAQGNEVLSFAVATDAAIRSGDYVAIKARDHGVSRFDDIKIETIGTLDPDAVDEVMAEEENEESPAEEEIIETQTTPPSPEEQLATLLQTQESLEASLVAKQAELAILHTEISTLQEQAEDQVITPEVRIRATRLQRHFTVEHTGMPEGYQIKFEGRFFDIDGSGSVTIDQLPGGNTAMRDVWLVDDNGDTVQRLGAVKISGGGVQKTGTQDTRIALSHLTYTQYSDPALQSTLDAVFATQANLLTEITTLQTELDTTIAEATAIQEAIYAAERALIPYSRMHLTTGSQPGALNVRFMSNNPQTYFVFDRIQNGYSNRLGQRLVEHPGGIMDDAFTMNFSQLGHSGAVTVRMYTDASQTELIEEIELGILHGGYLAGASEWDYEEFLSNPHVRDDTYGRYTDQIMGDLNNPMRLQAWDSENIAANLVVTETDGDMEYQFTGQLASIDFAQLGGSVGQLYGEVAIDSVAAVTAHFYRGGVEVGTQVLTDGSQLMFADVEGISAVVFTAPESVTMTLSHLNCTLNDEFGFEADSLDFAENGLLAMSATDSTQWGELDSALLYPAFDQFLTDNDIIKYHANGMAGPSQGQYFLLGFNNSTYTQYTLYKPESTQGSSQLGKVRYINDAGVHDLSEDYYTIINGALIIHPGAPTNIAVKIESGSQVIVSLDNTADTIDDLLATEVFKPELGVHHLHLGTHSSPGFTEGFTETVDTATPVIEMGMNFWAEALIHNRSGLSGTVTINVYSGPESNVRQNHMGTYTGSIGAYETKGFNANGIAHAVDLEEGDRPAILFEVTLPDGTTYETGKHGRKPGRMSPDEREVAIEKRKAELFDAMYEDMRTRYGEDSPEFASFLQAFANRFGYNVTVTAMQDESGGETSNAYDVVENGNGENGGGEVLSAQGITRVLLERGQGIVKNVDVSKNGTAEYVFTVEEDTMFNAAIPGNGYRNLDLKITGGSLPSGGYQSMKSGGYGDSISLKLTAGTYRVTVIDRTVYDPGFALVDTQVSLTLDVVAYNSANIEGRISLEGSNETMPVSLRVAEFKQDGQRDTDYGPNGVSKLDPSKPVWVVIHGRDDSETGNNTNDLASALYEYSQAHNDENYQVVTVNWEQAAEDFNAVSPLGNAAWTPEVGKWLANQLMSLGVDVNSTELFVHSHGSYVGYHAAKYMQQTGYGTVHGIVALDPAQHNEYFDGGAAINADRIVFSEVSQNSIGIQATVDNNDNLYLDAMNAVRAAFTSTTAGTIPALLDAWNNIEYGSASLAKTAHQSFMLATQNEPADHDDVHGYPVTAFANLIRASLDNNSELAQSPLGLFNFLQNSPGSLSMDPTREFDGVLLAHGYQDADSPTWKRARALLLDFEQSTDISLQ